MTRPQDPIPAEILSDSASGVLAVVKLKMLEQIAPARWRKPLRDVRVELQRGASLEMMDASRRSAWPRDLVAVYEQALLVDDPCELLLQAIQVRQKTRRTWNALISAICYPLALFVFAIGISVLFHVCLGSIAVFDMMEELGLESSDLKARFVDQDHALFGLGLTVVWIACVLLAVRVLGPPWAWISVVGGMVLIGKPLRWMMLSELLHRYRLFITQGLDSVSAAEATAGSLKYSGQSQVAHRIARQITAGMPLGEALANSILCDSLTRPILRFLDCRSTQAYEGSLLECCEVLELLTRRRCQTLAIVLPSVALLVVGAIICSIVVRYLTLLMPIVTLITSLA